MKVKVIKSFVDKYTQKVHKVDEVFECEAKRYEEIEKTDHFVEKTKAKAEAKASE